MRLAVIPTAGNRDCLAASFVAIAAQVDDVFIVHNGLNFDQIAQLREAGAVVVPYFGRYETYNLSAAWNQGARLARACARGEGYREWFTAFINDDSIVSDGWFGAVTKAMEETGADAGSSDNRHGHRKLLKQAPSLGDTLRGWAYILRGSANISADENMAWWYGDNDIAWQVTEHGNGLVTIPDYPVQNLYPNGSFTPELHERARMDREFFIKKWGRAPW